ALYVALISYDVGLIPSKLAFSIAATRESVPFPPFVEALFMTITMELLREAGARLPTTIGQTIGIVGGLVIGEAAVSAGIVSPVMVIVVALNAIASFAVPSYSVAITFRIIMFGFMLAAAVFGLFGIILAYIMLNIHIVNLKSIGVPYSTPFAPTFLSDWNDLIFRAPVPLMTRRPKAMQTNDKVSADRKEK
ncbi:MAG TPA: spore germination protein, partial [Lentibacillus sp.]|uniref:spore germination protein n=1 Tax=Lentibacillus sp. TaxID=1925746 RepID=UPI002B4ADAB2